MVSENAHTPKAALRMPKFARVREAIRKQIAEGVYTPGLRLPSQNELAKTMRVNHLTVRRALQDLVGEGLIVRRRGSGTYVSERRAGPLPPGRRLRVALLYHDALNERRYRERMLGRVAAGMLAELGMPGRTPEFRKVGERENTRAFCGSPDGAVSFECIGESWHSYERRPNLAEIDFDAYDAVLALSIIEDDWLQVLVKSGRPVVIVDYVSEKLAGAADQVFFDPLHGYRAAVLHLAAKGLRRIHFVGCNLYVPAPSPGMEHDEWVAYVRTRMRVDPDSYLRMNAWRQAMHECGLPVQDDWLHFCRSEAPACKALAEEILKRPASERPEAVIAHGLGQARDIVRSFTAHGEVLWGAGTGIPQEMEGEDKDRLLPVLADAHQMGAVAASLAVSRLLQPGRPYIRVGVPMQLQPAASRRSLATRA